MSIDDDENVDNDDEVEKFYRASTNRKNNAANGIAHQVVEMPSTNAKQSSFSIGDLSAKQPNVPTGSKRNTRQNSLSRRTSLDVGNDSADVLGLGDSHV